MLRRIGDKLIPYNGTRQEIQKLAEKDRFKSSSETQISYAKYKSYAKKLLAQWYKENYEKNDLKIEIATVDDTTNLEESVSGSIDFSLKDNHLHININKNDKTYRKSFTLMHEVGHFRLHIMPQKLKDGQALRNNANNFIESQANLYAASFLAPRKLIKETLRSHDKNYKSTLKEIYSTEYLQKHELIVRVANDFKLFYAVIYYIIKNNYDDFTA